MERIVRIRLASSLAVEVAETTLEGRALGSRKHRTLLALLAAERGQLLPVDRLVDEFWPEAPPTDPAGTSRPW